jgi:hypothetical protein
LASVERIQELLPRLQGNAGCSPDDIERVAEVSKGLEAVA